MPEELLASFAVHRLSVLAPDGSVDAALLPALSASEVRRLYELLVLARTFDERALALQREGRLGTYPPSRGQEAAQVGSAFALQPGDWVFPSFRELGVQLTLGYPIHQLFQYWAGDERGNQTPEGLNIFPVCVSVGTHLPHAVGAALAARYRRDPIVVAAYFGDGATSKGDFHEALNLAGLFRLPVLFICQNNQWAISVPLQGQTATASLAQKAVAYGFKGVQVDGNDVFAVYRAVRAAREQALDGGGPTLIECHTYRLADHTTADDAARYRSAEEVAAWQERDPLLRLERYLASRGGWDEAVASDVRRAAAAAVDAGVRCFEATPPPAPDELFAQVTAIPSPRREEQQRLKGEGPWRS
jgi:pyruvate dehydrogenase E1 component alpha subunit